MRTLIAPLPDTVGARNWALDAVVRLTLPRLLVAALLSTGCTAASDSGHVADTGRGPVDSADTGSADSDDSADTGEAPDACDETQPWINVSAGAKLTCGVHADGCAECWGLDYTGPLDTGVYGHANRHVLPLPPGPWRKLYLQGTGDDYSNTNVRACGEHADGSLECWGDGEPGGYPSKAYNVAFEFKTVACATVSAGAVTCWPENEVAEAYAAPEGIAAIAIADIYISRLRTDGVVETLYDHWIEVDDPAGGFMAMDASGEAVCALGADGAAWCWWPGGGIDDHSFLHDLTPTPEGEWASICLTQKGGGNTACALDESGYPTCWGRDLGPEPVERFAELSCGEFHVCGLTLDGRIACWGDCENGECDPPQ